MNKPRILLSAALLLTLASASHAADSLLKSATYCRTLDENQSAKDKAESFYPDEKIYLSIELKGRPKSGIAAAKFFFQDQLIAEAKVDVAEVNKGVFFSVGQNTFVGFSLKPNSALPVGAVYHADVTFEGAALGTFPFVVAPPKDSIPSKINSVTLARGIDDKSAPVDETRAFTTLQKVVLAGRGDLGNGSWLEVNWMVGGKLDPAGTKSFTMEENKKDVPFYFSFFPKGGWPEGTHEAVVVVNGKEAAREKFTVKADPNMKLGKPAVAKVSLSHDDGKGAAGEAAQSFGTNDKIIHAEFSLTAPALVQGTRVIWTLVEAVDAKNEEIAVAPIEDEGPQKSLTSFLRVKNGLPPGKYCVQLLLGDEELGRQDFEVKAAEKSVPSFGGGLKSRKQD